jgi:hypothetical protein
MLKTTFFFNRTENETFQNEKVNAVLFGYARAERFNFGRKRK